ncbi:MAG: pyrroline-5-carboxylate reductase [Pseudomonadota bacterium]
MTSVPPQETSDSLVHLLAGRAIVLLGCGKMGSAMLEGWLASGVSPGQVHVLDPQPSDWLDERAVEGLRLNKGLAEVDAAVVILAVKPQMMDGALPAVAGLTAAKPLFLSIAAGKTLTYFADHLGQDAAIVRSMPNTPAAVGRGITALIANAHVDNPQIQLAEVLLAAIGETAWLETEDQIDAVTGVSGSGPAYVFHLVEALAAAGEAEGLAPELALRLARATVAGAGELLHRSPETAEQLRINVTSPAGTTAAGLEQLMDEKNGLKSLMQRTVAAAAGRSRELAG